MFDEKRYYIDGPVTIEFRRPKTPEQFSNPYYTVEPIMKNVPKAEFDAFIKNYPRHLEVDVTGICDPPYISYNDFELADRWPSSVVASTSAYDDEPGQFYYCPEEERVYRVMKNYADVFESRTWYKATKGENPYVSVSDAPTCEENIMFSMKNVKPCSFSKEVSYE